MRTLFKRLTGSPVISNGVQGLRRLVKVAGIIAILGTTFVPPIAVGISGFYYEKYRAEDVASQLARKLQDPAVREKMLSGQESPWIGSATMVPGIFGNLYRQSILSADGQLLSSNGRNRLWPVLVVTAPVRVDGQLFGTVEIVGPLRPLFRTLFVVGVVGLMAALVAWFLMHRLPLRVLDRAFGELENTTRLHDTVLNNLTLGISMHDANRKLVFCNHHYAEMYRLPEHLTVPGTPIADIIDWRAKNNLHHGTDPEEFKRMALQGVAEGRPSSPVHQLPDGRMIAIRYQKLPGGGGVVTHDDVTAQRQMRERLQHLAQHDPLTGLTSWTHLQERMDAVLSHGPVQLAVLRINLGRFYKLVSLHGQRMGDAILKLAAARLRACIGENDIAARKEGDTFVVVQSNNDQPGAAAKLAETIVDTLQQTYEIEGSAILLDPKIGIAMSPLDGEDTDELLANAHVALQGARVSELLPFQFFAPEMDKDSKQRRSIELGLADALRNEQFEIHYQPLVNLASGEITGCEALLRWNHPEHGNLSPALFIPVAESSGLISALGSWVLRRACADAATWPGHIKVAVNLSPVQFRMGDVVKSVVDSLEDSKLAPTRLDLEITEATLLTDNGSTLEMLRKLKKLGIRISMDDFGTGYSSLGYLRNFPFDKIKIDRSFISGLSSEDPHSRVLMRAVARVGTSLGLTTLAEGIETQEQLDIVRQEGCLEGQGYLFSRPVSAKAIHEMLWRRAAVALSQDSHEAQGSVGVKASARAVDAAPDEEARLRALYELDILDTLPEEAFDRITRLARATLNAPMAMISLIDRDRQWFKSRQGIAVDETPRHFSFCTHTVARQSPLIVTDALLDDRFKASPLVTHDPKVRAYAGVPLKTASGFNVGALCINDTVPREVTKEQIELLQDLAQLVVDEMELRRIALIDQVTGLMTMRRFREIAQRKIAAARTAGRDVVCIVTNLDSFRAFNNAHGHGTGDIVLSAAARACSELVDKGDLIARLANDKFVILQFETAPELAALRAQEYRTAIELAMTGLGHSVAAAAGVVCLRTEDVGIDDLVDRARQAVRKNDGREKPDVRSGSRLVA